MRFIQVSPYKEGPFSRLYERALDPADSDIKNMEF
jgi:hypothetical protein